MGRAGKATLPTALKVLRGNPGKRALPNREPKPEPCEAQPPDWLDGDALVEFRSLAKMLNRVKVLTDMDARHLGILCDIMARYKALREAAKDAAITASIHEELASVQTRMFRLGAHFGLTPSSRSGLMTIAGGEEDEKEIKMFGKGG